VGLGLTPSQEGPGKHFSTPDKLQDNVVINGDFEYGMWMFSNETLGVLLSTNLDVATSSLLG